MNREIKFRGIDADRGDWVYGFLIKYITGYCEICYQEEVTSLKTLVKRRVLPETVGQLTGLQDKNGKDIYEDDIIRIPVLYETPEMTGKTYSNWRVVFVFGQWTLQKEDSEPELGEANLFDEHHSYDGDFEVVGNIYENGDLLTPVI